MEINSEFIQLIRATSSYCIYISENERERKGDRNSSYMKLITGDQI